MSKLGQRRRLVFSTSNFRSAAMNRHKCPIGSLGCRRPEASVAEIAVRWSSGASHNSGDVHDGISERQAIHRVFSPCWFVWIWMRGVGSSNAALARSVGMATFDANFLNFTALELR